MATRTKWKSIAVGFGTINLLLIAYVFAGSLTGCEKQEYEKGYLSIFVENEAILPVHVYLGTNNKIGVVRTTNPDPSDCTSSHVGIELIADHEYELIMYGKNWEYKKHVYIPADRCKKIIAK